jgi:hypothetical protein
MEMGLKMGLKMHSILADVQIVMASNATILKRVAHVVQDVVILTSHAVVVHIAGKN